MTRSRGVEIRLVLYVLCLLPTKPEVLWGEDEVWIQANWNTDHRPSSEGLSSSLSSVAASTSTQLRTRLSNLAPHPQRQLLTRRTPRTRHARRRVGERAEEALAEDQK